MAIAGSHPWGRRALIACYPIAANYSAQEVRALDGKRLCVAHRDEIITEAFLLAISFSVSDVPRPFDAQRDQGGRWFAQSHGINSSMRFCGQPFTRRVRRSVK